MIQECAQPGSELQRRIQQIWLPLFTPPPPPTYIPKEEFGKKMGAAIEARFHDVATAVEKLRARGGKIVFVRFPNSGDLKKLEDRETPRAGIWDRMIKETGAPGIYYEDYPELSGFNCPEWSHLSPAIPSSSETSHSPPSPGAQTVTLPQLSDFGMEIPRGN
jgi:hypothetical protein